MSHLAYDYSISKRWDYVSAERISGWEHRVMFIQSVSLGRIGLALLLATISASAVSAEMVFKYKSNSAGNMIATEPQAASTDCYDPNNVGTIGTGSECEDMLIVDDFMLRSAGSRYANPEGSFSSTGDSEGDQSFEIIPDDDYAPDGLINTYTFADSARNVFTGQVKNMSFLLQMVDFNGDIGYWDVSGAETTRAMIRHNDSFNQDISAWDVSNVKNMRGMFEKSDRFNRDISSWDVSNATNMAVMFFISKGFNQDISEWDVSSVTDSRYFADKSPIEGTYKVPNF